MVGVQSSMTVWEPGKQPLPAQPEGNGPTSATIAADHGPSTRLREVVGDESALRSFKEIAWREGTDRKLQSRFAAVRVRPAHTSSEYARSGKNESGLDFMTQQYQDHAIGRIVEFP